MAPIVAKNAAYMAYPRTKYRAPHPSMTPQLMSSKNAKSSSAARTVWKSAVPAVSPWVAVQDSIHALCSMAMPNPSISAQLSAAHAAIWVKPTRPMPAILPANS